MPAHLSPSQTTLGNLKDMRLKSNQTYIEPFSSPTQAGMLPNNKRKDLCRSRVWTASIGASIIRIGFL